jgi:hypothetical protein
MTPLAEADIQDMVGSMIVVDSSTDPLVPKDSPLTIAFSRFSERHRDHPGPVIGDNVLATVHLEPDGKLALRNVRPITDTPLFKERQVLQPA